MNAHVTVEKEERQIEPIRQTESRVPLRSTALTREDVIALAALAIFNQTRDVTNRSGWVVRGACGRPKPVLKASALAAGAAAKHGLCQQTLYNAARDLLSRVEKSGSGTLPSRQMVEARLLEDLR